jgi:hypothetical protein
MLQERSTAVPGKETQPSSHEFVGTVRPAFQPALHPILHLQRAVGNRRLAELIKAGRFSPQGHAVGAQPKLVGLPFTSGSTSRTASGEIRRREVAADSEVRRPSDWTEADRINSTSRWADACLFNLNAGDSSQYSRV